ncbi:hypothetical protein [Vitiosangium sp. GDMCC 1.1324]|uniref:hypothetical protein n=1 Tax=Vitiosangium sp. (strain GDMCC 1.1324) TaxID=2138576 RepID=UPI000D376EC6|nr:hypothetical protein [Vitiosangium sp. GDMCC 1.1324]PTL76320.1 hypothetical protein DAT35_50685 [Vitiosangium sp. GDMCC 1.1324]
MKRFMVSVLVVAGALLSACTQTQETVQSAGLAGTFDLALVNDLLFVTSTDNNELRVLELAVDASQRRFVRAPNPLQPLSIPVLPRPQRLTRDVRYDAGGLEKTGSYVYARSSGSTQISVVSAASERLTELVRLDTKVLTQGQSAGPVTAFAALAAEVPEGQEGGSTLYFATQEVSGSRLWQVQLPGPEELIKLTQGATSTEDPVPGLTAQPVVDVSFDNVAITSILVMPQAGELAVSTRTPASSTTSASGKSYWVKLGTKEVRELKFGAQVLQLVTHETVGALTAGQRIFGVLDASSCGGQSQCTGVLAVETATGELSKDFTGYPMLPINAGSGLPMGLSLSTNTYLSRQTGEPYDSSHNQRSPTVPLLGIVPLSNGQILFFDAVNLVPFNTNANNVTAEDGTVSTVNQASATVVYVDAQGNQLDPGGTNGTVNFEVTYGVTRDQTYAFLYQSILPGMASLTRDTESSTFEVPNTPGPSGEQVVQPGDIIVLLPGGVGQQPCGDELQVASVQPSATSGRFTLVPSGPIPEACANYTQFEVRAGGSKPLVLISSTESFIKRVGVQEEFSRTGTYFFHPPGYQGQTEGTAVKLTVGRLAEGIARGARYVVTTQSFFFPFVITVDTVNYADFVPFRLPGPVVRAHVGEGDSAKDYAYIVYPSANGILQVDLSNVQASVANSQGLVPYR